MMTPNPTVAEPPRYPGVSPRMAIGAAVLASFALLLLANVSFTARLLSAPDARIQDWRTANLAPRATEMRDDIAVVLIDEESLENYIWLSPVNRQLQAELVRGLEEAGARAIGLDFLYTGPTTEADDAALKAALKAAKIPIVIGALDSRHVPRDAGGNDALAWQKAFVKETGRPAGHLYFHGATTIARLSIADQVVRQRLGPSPVPPSLDSFPRALAVAADVETLPPPIDEPDLIAWQRPPSGSLSEEPFHVLRVRPHAPGASIEDMLGTGWQSAIKGRIVLIGGGFGDRDRHLTPLSVASNNKAEGVRIHGQILAQLIDQRSVATLPVWLELPLLVGLTLAGWWVAQRTFPLPLGETLTGAPQRFRPDPGGFMELSLAGALILLTGLIAYGLFGLVMPSATIFAAFVVGLLLGNPPHWLGWVKL